MTSCTRMNYSETPSRPQQQEIGLGAIRVYAILGLALPAEHDELVRPNYRKDLRRLVFDVLSYCQISRKDVVRYVSFLYELLDIAGDKNVSSSLSREFKGSRNRTVELAGFSSGTIVCRNMYNEGLSTTEAFSGDPQSERQMRREFRNYSQASILRMLQDL